MNLGTNASLNFAGKFQPVCIRIARRACYNPNCWAPPLEFLIFTVVGQRICFSNKFQGAAGTDFENHCPTASNPVGSGIAWILYNRRPGVGGRGMGPAATGPPSSCPPDQNLTGSLESSSSSVSVSLSKGCWNQSKGHCWGQLNSISLPGLCHSAPPLLPTTNSINENSRTLRGVWVKGYLGWKGRWVSESLLLPTNVTCFFFCYFEDSYLTCWSLWKSELGFTF